MTFVKLIEYINVSLSGEMLQYQDLELILDDSIDDVNDTLNSTFPTFSEIYHAGRDGYVDEDGVLFFPDRYMRSVIIPMAAYKFYMMDEEGVPSAPAYYAKYKEGLFKMLRDFLDHVPEKYRRDSHIGSRKVEDDYMYANSEDAAKHEKHMERIGGMWDG